MNGVHEKSADTGSTRSLNSDNEVSGLGGSESFGSDDDFLDTEFDNNDVDKLIDELDSGLDDEVVETPAGFPDLCLNPSGEGVPMNPLCPVCEEPITPVEGECERRYNCGCDILRKFKFE